MEDAIKPEDITKDGVLLLAGQYLYAAEGPDGFNGVLKSPRVHEFIRASCLKTMAEHIDLSEALLALGRTEEAGKLIDAIGVLQQSMEAPPARTSEPTPAA